MSMRKNITPDEIRGFFTIVAGHFDNAGIRLRRVLFERGEDGGLVSVRLVYDSQAEPDKKTEITNP